MASIETNLEQQKLEQLIELAGLLSQQNSFQEILRLVAQKSAHFLNAELALILMLNPRSQKTVKTILKEGREVRHPHYQSVQNQISGWVMKYRESLLISNIRNEPRFSNIILKDLPIKAVMGVPLQSEGTCIGSLILLNSTASPTFDESGLLFLEKIAVIAAPYLRNVQKIQEYFEVPLPDANLQTKYQAIGLLGKSPPFVELLRAIESAAQCDVRVLLEGQSGTGKELIARAIHKFSARSNRPFVAIDCGAIPNHLLESELFGHTKGAFTGATTDRKGLLQEADGGTLFMDEIANLPLDMQSKLMRVLQEGEVRPLGSNKSRTVNVRVISASSNSLKNLVAEQKFREDLFYRIYVYPISVPSLLDRPDDIPLLANHFLRQFASQQKKQAESFHKEILNFMQERPWNGNIRELENFVERLVTLAPQGMRILGRKLLPEDLQTELRNAKFVYDDLVPKSLIEILAEHEAQLLRDALTRYDWNQSRAARSLKIPVQTLRNKMKKLGIAQPV